VLIATSQAMFKPGLDRFSHGVGPVLGGKPSLWSRRKASNFCFASVLVFPVTHRRCRLPVGLNPTSTAAIHRCRDSSQ
jgi:hypothetical protein